MGFVKRDRIGSFLQEVAAFIHERLQVEFNGLSVEKDDRTPIPCRPGVRFQVQRFDEGLGGFVERPGVQMNFDIAAVVPGSVVAFDYRLGLGSSKDGYLVLHESTEVRIRVDPVPCAQPVGQV